jgi:enterobactin synthetase component F
MCQQEHHGSAAESPLNSERFPLLSAQRDVFFGHLLDKSRCAYNTGLYTEITGEFDLPTLKKAAAHVVNLTDALRLRFHAADDELWQEVLESHRYELPVVDVTYAVNPQAAGIKLIDQNLHTPFHLAEEAPFRWLVIRIGDSRWLWSQIYHHIALDGQSAWIVSNRVAETYSALREGKAAPEYPVRGIAVLTSEEASYRTSSRFLKDRHYWEASLASSEKMMSWSCRSRHGSVANRVVRETCHLPPSLTAKVRDLARNAGLRSEHLVMAAAAIIQSAYQGLQDVVLGTQLLGRLASSARAFPAMASNEGHIRLTVDPALKCEALTKEISRQMRLALRHQSYRYEDLRHDLGLLPGEPDHFSLSVNIMPVDSDLQLHGLRSASSYLSYGPVRDLSLTLFDNKAQERLRLDLDGNASHYQPSDLKKHLSQIVSVIDQIATATVPIGAITLSGDTGELKTEPLKVKEAGIQSETLLDVLAATAKVSPTKIAVICGEKSFTYDELEKRSNRLSRFLVHRGLGPESIVAIGLERSFDMLVATLATLKAGAACLPLDLNYPVDRLDYMLVDSGVDVLLTQRGADMFAAHRIPTIPLGECEFENALAAFDPSPLMQQDRITPLHSQNIAFLLYTSGSTGQPKGVGLTHQNLTNKLLDQLCLWNVDQSSRFAFSSSINFDPSIHQMLLPLAAGGTCVVLSSEEVRDSDRFMQEIAKSAVTHLDVVPAFASVIADQVLTGRLYLEVFILGGEILPAQLLQKLRSSLPNCRFFNMYGPTETCVDATAFEVAAEFSDSPIPIGRALHNYGIYILDGCLRPLPQGVVGEIYIAGAGVARGYWRRARLTAERFLPCPFGSPGERMYRTGDRGYRNANGDIIFGGRYDGQIKLRGVRIELSEIEAVLLGQDGVEQAAVVLEDNGADGRLMAYVSVAPGAELHGQDLRRMLATSLPGFMVPSAIAVLETMPRLPNGKLDRASLPSIQPDDVSNHVEPGTDLEAHICLLFRSLTGVKQVSALDNFFALGGHSLLVMRLVSRLRSEHGHDLPLEFVFTHPTPRALAAAISARGQYPPPYYPLVRLRDSGPGLPLFCVHPAAGLARVYDRMVDSIDAHIPIYGLQARGIDDGAPLHASIPEMARAYVDAVRDLQDRGPYYLAGWSFGGVVAHEMAALLEARGEEVGRLFLIDSYFSNVDADVVDSASAIRSMIGWDDTGQGLDQDGASEPLLQRISAAFVQSARLIAEHTPSKIRGPIVFFRAKDNAQGDLSSSLGMIRRGAIEIEEADACHYSLFDVEHAGKIGVAINRYMTRTITGAPSAG